MFAHGSQRPLLLRERLHLRMYSRLICIKSCPKRGLSWALLAADGVQVCELLSRLLECETLGLLLGLSRRLCMRRYDATSHFETTVEDVLEMYTRITGKVLDLSSKDPSQAAQ